MTAAETTEVQPDATRTLLEALAADTPEDEIHQRGVWERGKRVQNPDGTDKMLSYVTARYVQDRLDTVIGPHLWENRFESLPTGAVRCGIGITFNEGLPDERTVWKYDVGVPSSIEAEKGAHSDAFKRAGVMWGIARDLYDERDEDRPPAPAPAAAPNQAPSVPIRDRVTPGAPAAAAYDEDGDGGQPQQMVWVCPVHDDAKIIPAGVSKRTGRKYNAFYACPVAGCDQKGPSA